MGVVIVSERKSNAAGPGCCQALTCLWVDAWSLAAAMAGFFLRSVMEWGLSSTVEEAMVLAVVILMPVIDEEVKFLHTW